MSPQIKKYRNATEELADLERKLAEAEAVKEASKAQRGGEGGEDDLDSFMRSLKSQVPDKHKRVTWKVSLFSLFAIRGRSYLICYNTCSRDT